MKLSEEDKREIGDRAARRFIEIIQQEAGRSVLKKVWWGLVVIVIVVTLLLSHWLTVK